ncbi:MAG: TRAP transporter small permease subunit [Pseudomonadota bacterium]
MFWADLMAVIKAFSRMLRTLEVSLLCGLFLAIVLLGLTQIGLRNLADSSLAWSDAAMRAGVLWIAMIAACVAAREAKHIRIDLLSRLLPTVWARWIGRLMLFVTAIICMLMVYGSLDIVRIELEFQELAFLMVPRWLVLGIIPVGFSLMAFRFVYHSVCFEPNDQEPG